MLNRNGDQSNNPTLDFLTTKVLSCPIFMALDQSQRYSSTPTSLKGAAISLDQSQRYSSTL